MKCLADMGVSMKTVTTLREKGHDVVHIRERHLARALDSEILRLAKNEQRVLLTFDLDFGDILAASGEEIPSVIIFRLRNQLPSSVTKRVVKVFSEQEEALLAGVLILIEESRYRLRHLPIH